MRQIMNEQLLISRSNPIKARRYDYDRFFYPWHFHSQYELIYVRSSYGHCFVGDCIEPFEAGDLFLFGSHLPHYMHSHEVFGTPAAPGRVQGTIIQFEQNFMDYSIEHYPQFLPIKHLLTCAMRGVRFSRQSGELFERFPEYEGIEQICQLLQLLQHLSNASEYKELASPLYYKEISAIGDKRIDRVISYLNGNYTRHLSLEGIAQMASMNATAFCRYFKQHTGKTLLQYITEMRIGYACQLLMIGNTDVAQIAIECGFESITQFNRTFKQATQLTPTQYREKHRI